ncbi:FAD-dependent monooxygenase [Streptomyces sp. NPDC001339]|uniref:FAD-dependent monooxygenase n=1 Tax=Streptomyces sp. NPDC001339 TaxID=3364563 RepID=UPI003679595E
MTITRRRKVIIIGAGIGGLTAAATLRRMGLSVEIHERATELRPVGTGLSIMCNALTALRAVGVDLHAALHERSQSFDAIHVMRSDGRPIRTLRTGEIADRLESANFAVHRADLQQVLLDALGDDCPVELGAKATGFTVDEDGVTVEFADGRSTRGDVLIGADGFHSAIRRQLVGPERPDEHGYLCWLATVPFEHPKMPKGYVGHYWAPGKRFGLIDIGHGRAYWWGTRNVPTAVARSWDGPKEEILRTYAGWAEEVGAAIRETAREDIVTVPAKDRPFLERWGYGPVTLLGDAAHPMLTSLGQGAAMAMEDAAVLAESLAGAQDLPRALRDYENRRRARTRQMVQSSRSLSRIEQWEKPLSVRARELYFRYAPESVFAKQNDAVLHYRPVAAS